MNDLINLLKSAKELIVESRRASQAIRPLANKLLHGSATLNELQSFYRHEAETLLRDHKVDRILETLEKKDNLREELISLVKEGREIVEKENDTNDIITKITDKMAELREYDKTQGELDPYIRQEYKDLYSDGPDTPDSKQEYNSDATTDTDYNSEDKTGLSSGSGESSVPDFDEENSYASERDDNSNPDSSNESEQEPMDEGNSTKRKRDDSDDDDGDGGGSGGAGGVAGTLTAAKRQRIQFNSGVKFTSNLSPDLLILIVLILIFSILAILIMPIILSLFHFLISIAPSKICMAITLNTTSILL